MYCRSGKTLKENEGRTDSIDFLLGKEKFKMVKKIDFGEFQFKAYILAVLIACLLSIWRVESSIQSVKAVIINHIKVFEARGSI